MRRRSGFTLVEVLVAMALILFIMSILAAAFTAAMQSVSDFKAAGDLAERLRGASSVLRRDLEADHFTDGPQVGPRLSDPNFWSRLTGVAPPKGVFRIFQQSTDQQEGVDLDGVPSFYQIGTALHYAINLHGTRRSDFLSAVVPPNTPLTTPQSPTPDPGDLLLGPPDERYQDTTNLPNASVYNSQLAEVVVFLAPNGDQTDGASGPALPLFTLCRRQFLCVPTGWTPPPPTGNPAPTAVSQVGSFPEVSTVPASPETATGNPALPLTFNDLQALTMPIRRFNMDRSGANPNQPAGLLATANSPTYKAPAPLGRYATMGESNGNFQAADLLLSDVVSFDVRVLVAAVDANGNVVSKTPDFVDLYDPSVAAFSGNNPAFTGNGPRAFDAWSNQADALTGTDYTQWDGPWRAPALPATAATIPLYKTAGANPQTISIQAIQIVLRVWDYKTKKTRQVTIVQQM